MEKQTITLTYDYVKGLRVLEKAKKESLSDYQSFIDDFVKGEIGHDALLREKSNDFQLSDSLKTETLDVFKDTLLQQGYQPVNLFELIAFITEVDESVFLGKRIVALNAGAKFNGGDYYRPYIQVQNSVFSFGWKCFEKCCERSAMTSGDYLFLGIRKE